MQSKSYWHEIPAKEMAELLDKGITEGEVLNGYLQPDWCTYHEALRSNIGCWSLTRESTRTCISIDFCKNCDCFKLPKIWKTEELKKLL